MGDVKLALLLGAGLGLAGDVALMIGMVAALVPSSVLFARHGQAARKMAIPFGPFLALGRDRGALRRARSCCDAYLSARSSAARSVLSHPAPQGFGRRDGR